MAVTTAHETDDPTVVHPGPYDSCRTCHGVLPCVVHPDCTGEFVPAMRRHNFTGWVYDPVESDVPVHDCSTEEK